MNIGHWPKWFISPICTLVTDKNGQRQKWSATHHLVFTQHWWLKSSPLSKKGGWPWNMAEVVSIITNHVAKIRFMKYGWDRNHMAIIPFTPPDIGFRLKKGGLTCPTPTCKPAGGKREDNTRMEERGFQHPFYSFNQIGLLLCSWQGWIFKWTPEKVGRDHAVLVKVNVLSLTLNHMLTLSVFLSAWYGLEAESTCEDGIKFKIICAFSLQ